jgi:hypothetical protein
MLDGVVFCRRTAGGRGSASSHSEVLFSRVKDSKSRDSLSVRFNGDVMKKLRWMVGDYVVAYPKDEGARWVFERVQGPQQGGIRICSGSSTSGSGVCRFTHENDVLDVLFRDGNKQFAGTLCDSQGNKAIVLVD